MTSGAHLIRSRLSKRSVKSKVVTSVQGVVNVWLTNSVKLCAGCANRPFAQCAHRYLYEVELCRRGSAAADD
jgi:hypothetical protein